MRDDEFLFDYIEFDEKLIPQNKILYHKKAQPPKDIYDYQNMKIQICVFSAIRAFSANWPYVACAGFQNYLILMNSFDSKFIQKIQLANERQKITICDSFMSDTYDLFVLIQ
jgi:hypothetical protein